MKYSCVSLSATTKAYLKRKSFIFSHSVKHRDDSRSASGYGNNCSGSPIFCSNNGVVLITTTSLLFYTIKKDCEILEAAHLQAKEALIILGKGKKVSPW